METRNHHITKFLRFDNKKHNLSLLLNILKSHNARNAYIKPDKNNVYVEFSIQEDRNNACLYTYYNYNIKIVGIPRELIWKERNSFFGNHKPLFILPSTEDKEVIRHNAHEHKHNNNIITPSSILKVKPCKNKPTYYSNVQKFTTSSNRIQINPSKLKVLYVADCIVESVSEQVLDLC